MAEDEAPLSLQQEEEIRNRARHDVDISNNQLWALLDELDRTRKERGQQRVAKNAALRTIAHPEILSMIRGSLLRIGGHSDSSLVEGEAFLLKKKIEEFLRSKSERAEHKET